MLSDRKTAKVSGFARSFLTSWPIPDATITILESGEKFKTDNKGRFGPIEWPVGSAITLVLEKEGYRTTQTATVIVPPEGLNTAQNEMTFQVPSDFAFALFALAMGVTIDEKACQIVATITAYGKTMDDIPQGEEKAEAILSPNIGIKPFYFGLFEGWWPLKHKTNPLVRNLIFTSADGGVGFLNVPPSEKPYKLTAFKSGTLFSEVLITARKGVFINASPPQSPSVTQHKVEESLEHRIKI